MCARVCPLYESRKAEIANRKPTKMLRD